ncbi:PD40 domain-containing protein [Psittacicella hinzii]|uniref:TolB N-terminal domain-containing protein n=1 Tax=Psittacicella hinzii TaxID=2028575 RepID=A0A3A1YRA2_9GAMM|nr:PD40 domain-containing protein [Psittacicella hinzii]RIY39698.1 hypothetical protein CKF58_01755 [Psittacicella hinzii]
MIKVFSSYKLWGVGLACFYALTGYAETSSNITPVTDPNTSSTVINIDQGTHQAQKIAIANFSYAPGVNIQNKLETIIGADLQNTGIFAPVYAQNFPQDMNTPINPNVWNQAGVFYLVTGAVSPAGQGYKLDYNLYDMSGAICPVGQACISRSVTYTPGDQRKLAHAAADSVFTAITKKLSDFLTKIAYVQQPIAGVNEYNLYIADYDGYNAKKIYTSSKPILSPDWSPDNSNLAFVTYTTFSSVIMQYNLASGRVYTVVNRLGNSSAPAYSADGNYLAYVYGNNGKFDIYLRNLKNNSERNLTNGAGRNSEPAWYGNSLIFTSDRGGNAAIYQMDLGSGQAYRISRTSGQTTNADVSYSAKTMVFINRDRITAQDLTTGKTTALSSTYLDEGLTLSPNGQMVIYSSTVGNNKRLNLISIDGYNRVTLPLTQGSYSNAAWSNAVTNP